MILKFCSVWRVRRLRKIIASNRCEVSPGITHNIQVSDLFLDRLTCVTMSECTKCGKYWW
jgi:hypothetical protein